MKYKNVVVTQRGGPEVLQIVGNDLRPPIEGEARIRILATPVCQDDVAVRVGNRPFLTKPPFVPGYTFVGVVDAIGERVSSVKVGDRVAALTSYGSHAEFIETILSGSFADQAALFGTLTKIQVLNLSLISVIRSPAQE